MNILEKRPRGRYAPVGIAPGAARVIVLVDRWRSAERRACGDEGRMEVGPVSGSGTKTSAAGKRTNVSAACLLEPIPQAEGRQQWQPAAAHLGELRPIGAGIVDQVHLELARVVTIEQVDHFEIELPAIT